MTGEPTDPRLTVTGRGPVEETCVSTHEISDSDSENEKDKESEGNDDYSGREEGMEEGTGGGRHVEGQRHDWW